MYIYVDSIRHACAGQRQLIGVSVLLHHLGPRDQIQVISFSSKCHPFWAIHWPRKKPYFEVIYLISFCFYFLYFLEIFFPPFKWDIESAGALALLRRELKCMTSLWLIFFGSAWCQLCLWAPDRLDCSESPRQDTALQWAQTLVSSGSSGSWLYEMPRGLSLGPSWQAPAIPSKVCDAHSCGPWIIGFEKDLVTTLRIDVENAWTLVPVSSFGSHKVGCHLA